MNFSWLMPETVSTFGPALDNLYYVILWITGIVFVITEIALVVVLVKYRHREGRRAEYSHGSTKAEIVWSVTPFVIVMGLVIYSKGLWDEIRDPAHIPPGAYQIDVVAKQFEWNATYPGQDGQLGTSDDFVARNALHIPVNQPVQVNLQAEDVIHSFFLPDFRVKHDAVPGMNTPVWFEATRTGEFPLACAELCGLGHYRMMGSVTVHSQADFQAWLDSQQVAEEEDDR